MTETFIEEKYHALNKKCLNLEAQLKRANMKLDTIDAVAKQLVHMTNIATNHRIQIDEALKIINNVYGYQDIDKLRDHLRSVLKTSY